MKLRYINGRNVATPSFLYTLNFIWLAAPEKKQCSALCDLPHHEARDVFASKVNVIESEHYVTVNYTADEQNNDKAKDFQNNTVRKGKSRMLRFVMRHLNLVL